MLIEFTIANYRSFRDPVLCSMVAANLKSRDEQLDENNVFQIEGQPALLTSAAIYGRNASGKSNLVRALQFMRQFVLESFGSTEETGSIDVEPFRLNTATVDQPSHFEIVFVSDGVRYRYGFEATRERVTAEWLYAVPKRSEVVYFQRELDEISLGRSFAKEGRERKQFTRQNALFLTVLAQANAPTAQKLLKWFRSKLGIASGIHDLSMRMYTQLRLLEGRNTDPIIRLVTAADTGVEGLRVEASRRDEMPDFPPEVPAEVRAALTTVFNHSETMRVDVSTLHTVYDAKGRAVDQIEFDLDEQESEGTSKLFALAGPLSSALGSGQIVVIDEFDARFHPLLTRQIIELFNNPSTNPQHAQLIIVTHDSGLMDNRRMRRDQIWFVEKDGKGVSTLYSLAEFKGIRNDKDYERGYLEGRFGAIPYVFNLAEAVASYEVEDGTAQ